ncbi:DUF982 domain-containing protein [Rhizobium grahamii]|uniref:DUF982 domain-containing protein n=1 Tax=Rhizobium grahamii TaxID=1120045 RepID=A0A5Q0C756_9HYPH|nr:MULTISPECIES: DUF982 domain-containing protein [Rhizobium]QFY61145.1 DUF982 domain-containing protein [Rhizobium grahamii]QRM49702.1 DUF982 domain-containing protein [Rhizobium sp. BG6]
MPTPDILWNTPINVRLQNGTEKSLHSIHDALDLLENQWPKVHGAYHDAAVASCRNALKRQTPPAVSKELFLAACLEAGFAVRGGPRRASVQRFSETAHRPF